MPAGHTDKATINKRRPLTERMRGLLAYLRVNPKTKWGDLSEGDKNAVRGLRDRGLVDYNFDGDPIRLSEAGRDYLSCKE